MRNLSYLVIFVLILLPSKDVFAGTYTDFTGAVLKTDSTSCTIDKFSSDGSITLVSRIKEPDTTSSEYRNAKKKGNIVFSVKFGTLGGIDPEVGDPFSSRTVGAVAETSYAKYKIIATNDPPRFKVRIHGLKIWPKKYMPIKGWADGGLENCWVSKVNGDGTLSNVVGVSAEYIHIGSRNTAPTAKNISKTINEDIKTTFNASYTDPDSGDSHTLTNVTQPSKGSVSVSGVKFTYNPPANWSGTTSFTYRVRDAAGEKSGVATVTIRVNPVNDPPDVSVVNFNLNEDTSQTKTPVIYDVDG